MIVVIGWLVGTLVAVLLCGVAAFVLPPVEPWLAFLIAMPVGATCSLAGAWLAEDRWG